VFPVELTRPGTAIQAGRLIHFIALNYEARQQVTAVRKLFTRAFSFAPIHAAIQVHSVHACP
jgi:hypothetical protein